MVVFIGILLKQGSGQLKFSTLLRFLSFVLLFSPFVTYSQSTNDSVNFVETKWTSTKIAKGTKLYTHSFSSSKLFGAYQNISFVEVKSGWLRPKFKIAAGPKELLKTSELARANKAIAAINGNFFNIKDGGAVDFTKVDGKVINKNIYPGKGISRTFHQKAALVIVQGRPSIIKWDGFENWEEWLKQPSVMVNGPLLLLNGAVQPLSDTASFNKTRHPRTCVGIKNNGAVVMLVADGRNKNAEGLSLFELTKIMRWLGCISAINFDGGGSTTLWTKETGIVNYPSDSKNWDKIGERKVANILFIR